MRHSTRFVVAGIMSVLVAGPGACRGGHRIRAPPAWRSTAAGEMLRLAGFALAERLIFHSGPLQVSKAS